MTLTNTFRQLVKCKLFGHFLFSPLKIYSVYLFVIPARVRPSIRLCRLIHIVALPLRVDLLEDPRTLLLPSLRDFLLFSERVMLSYTSFASRIVLALSKSLDYGTLLLRTYITILHQFVHIKQFCVKKIHFRKLLLKMHGFGD